MMDARGHLRSQATEDFLAEARKWGLDGNVIEHRRGCNDPDKVVTLELSLQQLARLADILRHAGSVHEFSVDHGYQLKDVDWRSFNDRLETERQIDARHRTLFKTD